MSRYNVSPRCTVAQWFSGAEKSITSLASGLPPDQREIVSHTLEDLRSSVMTMVVEAPASSDALRRSLLEGDKDRAIARITDYIERQLRAISADMSEPRVVAEHLLVAASRSVSLSDAALGVAQRFFSQAVPFYAEQFEIILRESLGLDGRVVDWSKSPDIQAAEAYEILARISVPAPQESRPPAVAVSEDDVDSVVDDIFLAYNPVSLTSAQVHAVDLLAGEVSTRLGLILGSEVDPTLRLALQDVLHRASAVALDRMPTLQDERERRASSVFFSGPM